MKCERKTFQSVLCCSDVPSAPLDLKTGDITETTVALSWKLPNDNGGSDITGYVVERRDANKTAWTKVLVTKCL